MRRRQHSEPLFHDIVAVQLILEIFINPFPVAIKTYQCQKTIRRSQPLWFAVTELQRRRIETITISNTSKKNNTRWPICICPSTHNSLGNIWAQTAHSHSTLTSAELCCSRWRLSGNVCVPRSRFSEMRRQHKYDYHCTEYARHCSHRQVAVQVSGRRLPE